MPRAIGAAYDVVPRGGVVHLAHVAETADKEAAAAARTRLAALVPPEADQRRVLTVLEVVDATDAAEALLQLGARRGVDVICIATHGRSGLFEALLGSVARRIVRRRAPCS